MLLLKVTYIFNIETMDTVDVEGRRIKLYDDGYFEIQNDVDYDYDRNMEYYDIDAERNSSFSPFLFKINQDGTGYELLSDKQILPYKNNVLKQGGELNHYLTVKDYDNCEMFTFTLKQYSQDAATKVCI